jgi:hypothetical protein
MKKWEYKEAFHYKWRSIHFIDFLNDEGNSGWELVSWKFDKTEDEYQCIFKREIIND